VSAVVEGYETGMMSSVVNPTRRLSYMVLARTAASEMEGA
jgi:hypothetical protein